MKSERLPTSEQVRDERKQTLRDVALVVLLGCVVNLPFLGQEYVFQSREVRHAGVCAEMADDGDFLVPHLLGQPYIYKQPVMHIPVALLFRLFGGPSTALARSVSALCGIAGAVLLYLLARRLYDRRTALWAGLILLASPGWALLGRTARPDMVFSLALLAMVSGLFFGMSRKRGALRVGWFALGGLAGGVAFLAKGPYGIFYPAVFSFSLALFACWGRPTYRFPRIWEWLLFGGALLLIPAAWALRVYLRDNGEYLSMVLHQHNAGTSAHARSPIYYLGPGLKMLLPWVLFTPWGFCDVWRDLKAARPAESKEDRLQFALHWLRHLRVQPRWNLSIPLIALALFVVFSAVPSKRWHYLGPWFPLAALALAAALAQREAKWISRAVWGVALGLILGVPLYMGVIQPASRGWENPSHQFISAAVAAVPEKSVLFTFSGKIEEFNFFGREAHKLPGGWRLVHLADAAPDAPRDDSEEEGAVTAVKPAELPAMVWEALREGRACYLAANGRNVAQNLAILEQLRREQLVEQAMESDADNAAATWYLFRLTPLGKQ